MARILSISVVAPAVNARALAAMASSGSNCDWLISAIHFAASDHVVTERWPPSMVTPTHGTIVFELGEACSGSMAARFSICQVKVPLPLAVSLGAPLKAMALISIPAGTVTENFASFTGNPCWKWKTNWLLNRRSSTTAS